MPDIQELVERLDKLHKEATPGEWSCHAPDCCGWIDYDDGVICDVKNNTDDLQDATGHAPTKEQARANQEWITAAHNAWPQLSAALQARQGWVSVEERLPLLTMLEDEPLFIGRQEMRPIWWSDKVLVYRAGRRYDYDITQIVAKEDKTRADWYATSGVTHWMPLPAPPEKP